MGMLDRDYYRDRLNARDQYVERAKFRVSLGNSSSVPQVRRWHPALLFLLFAVICALVFGALKGLSRFFG